MQETMGEKRLAKYFEMFQLLKRIIKF